MGAALCPAILGAGGTSPPELLAVRTVGQSWAGGSRGRTPGRAGRGGEVFLRSWGLEEALKVSGKLQGRETGWRGKGTEVEGCLRCPLLVEVQGDGG